MSTDVQWTAALQQELQAAILADDLSLDDLRQIVWYGMNQRLEHHIALPASLRDAVFAWLEVVQGYGWQESFIRFVYSYRPDNAHVPAFCRAHASYAITNPTPQQQAFNAAIRLAELGRRAAGPVRDRMREAAAASAGTLDRLDRMARYKQLHDVLHALDYGLIYELSQSVDRLRADPPRFRANPTEARRLRKYCGQLDEHVATAARAVEPLPPAERAREGVWVEQLAAAAGPIRAAVEPDGDTERVVPSVAVLARVLAQQPTRINARIIDLARDIDLAALAGRLRAAAAGLPPGEAAPLSDGLNDLADLGPRVAVLVAEHDAWQQLDNPLGMVAGDETALPVMWPQIAHLGRALAAAHPAAEWAAALAAALDRYAATDTVGRLTVFDEVRQLAGSRFRAVDVELLKLATLLGHVAVKIKTAAEVMTGADN